MAGADRPLHCTIKNPVLINLSDLKTDFHSGCKIIDVSLANIVNPEKPKSCFKSNTKTKSEEVDEVGDIVFKNNYTAYLTLKAKCRITDTKDGNEIQWRTCVKRMKLMPHPHVEAGAQDYFIITKKQMPFELINVSALRIILQQPSPVWKDFKIEDLKIFRGSDANRPNPLPAWLTDTPDKATKKKVEHSEGDWFPPSVVDKETGVMGVHNLEGLSANLQQLWALSEDFAGQQTKKALGRYEVEGCYEINLLSYT